MSENELGDPGESVEPPLWCDLSVADLDSVDVAALAAGLDHADTYTLGIEIDRAQTYPSGSPARRVQRLIYALCEMNVRPNSKHAPFGPMFQFPDGRRTPIPCDFMEIAEVIAVIASRSEHPVVRARLADVCWLLVRRRADMGRLAVSSYLEVLQQIQKGILRFSHYPEWKVAHPDAFDYLTRCLQIARALGVEKAEFLRAKQVFEQYRQTAFESGSIGEFVRWSRLDLNNSLSNAGSVAEQLEELASAETADFHTQTDICTLAIRAFSLVGDQAGAHRCQRLLSDRLAQEAIEKPQSAALAAANLSDAISALHGIPDIRARRDELKHLLIDVQGGILDEMAEFSYSQDISHEIRQVREACNARETLLDKLYFLIGQAHSVTPEQLEDDARDALAKSPLMAMMGASFYDPLGRLVGRTKPWSGESEEPSQALAVEIAKHEHFRRKFAAPRMHAVRLETTQYHYLSERIFRLILQYSPVVERSYVQTFARGFARFFEGDFIAALYIFTPLLEPTLLHMLRMCNFDTTKFDDATQTEEDRSLSQLFSMNKEDLIHMFDAAFVTDLENLFLNKWGPKIRHSVAHGLLTDDEANGPDATYAVVLIMKLCLLPTWGHREELRSQMRALGCG
ncbi:hypothetical protein RBI14_22420 [Alcaligenaceae bacterium B3P038]|nr:hypothetical protein [Alcaligenaceae bacterium B3P038]